MLDFKSAIEEDIEEIDIALGYVEYLRITPTSLRDVNKTRLRVLEKEERRNK
jgi:hypothetical protein